MRRMFKLVSCLLAGIVLGAANLVYADQGLGGSAPLKIFGDHLLVPITYKTEGFEKESHIVIDLGGQESGYGGGYVAVHQDVWGSIAQVLQAGEIVRLTGEDFELKVDPKRVVQIPRGPNTLVAKLSARYDIELNNIDVSAIVGFEFLKEYAINFNMEDKTFSMTPSSPSHTQQVRQSAQTFLTGVSVAGDNAYLPVSANGKQVGVIELQTAGYHTTITSKLAKSLNKAEDIYFGAPDGDQKLSGMVALRTKRMPKALRSTPRDRVMRSGIGLWASFDVTIDPKAGYLALTPTLNNNYNDGDVTFYKASTAKDWDQLYSYLQAFPKDRNVEEAVDELFAIGLRKKAPVDKQLAAMQVALDQMRDRRKLLYVFDYCQKAHDAMPSSAYMDMTIGVCEEGLKYISYSQVPGTRQDYQLILGERYLDKGDARTGWKYYLSASFNGDPGKDSVTRMGLGRAYEAMKRYRRAYATYKRLAAGATKEQLAQVGLDVAMERVAKHLDPNDPLLKEEK